MGLDCSSPWGSVALFDGTKVLGSVCVEGSREHPFQPVYWIERLLSSLNATVDQLGGVGVTLGPGVFTGLRVALSVAKGLAFSMDLPLYTLTSLESIALCVTSDSLLCPVLDARRGEFYAAIYRWMNGELEPVTDVMLLSKDQLCRMEGKVLFVGPGLSAAGVKGMDLPMPTAAAVARFAWARSVEGVEPKDLAGVVPLYVRLSDAEASRGIRVV